MVRKSNICPKCKSTNIEPSWGSEGYIQCNKCGHEWRQGKNKKINWSKIGKLPKPKIKFAYIIDKDSYRVVSRYIAKGTRPNHLMGAWTVEYPETSYKIYISNKERSVGYKFRQSRKKK